MSIIAGSLQGFELELAYALVGDQSIDACPQVDELLSLYCQERLRSVPHDDAIWELPGPRHKLVMRSKQRLENLSHAKDLFSAELRDAAELAGKLDGRLLATGMHPWMNAEAAELWPHGETPSDSALHAIFGKDRHGWANQQSLRLSLPFDSELEFFRLFVALRSLMPLMPAIAASSPFANGRRGPAMSCRLATRRDYVASDLDFSCSLVPPASECREAYNGEVVEPLHLALQARGLEGALSPMQVCGHGLVADFELGLVHIHMLDMQECLSADLAVCSMVVAMTQLLQNEVDASLAALGQWPSARLAELLESTLVGGSQAVLRDADFLAAFGFPEGGSCRASELLQFVFEERVSDGGLDELKPAQEAIVGQGALAHRLLQSLPERWNDEDLYNLYRKLSESLRDDECIVIS